MSGTKVPRRWQCGNWCLLALPPSPPLPSPTLLSSRILPPPILESILLLALFTAQCCASDEKTGERHLKKKKGAVRGVMSGYRRACPNNFKKHSEKTTTVALTRLIPEHLPSKPNQLSSLLLLLLPQHHHLLAIPLPSSHLGGFVVAFISSKVSHHI